MCFIKTRLTWHKLIRHWRKISCKSSKERGNKAPVLGHPHYKFPFFLFFFFLHENKENDSGVLTWKHEDYHSPIRYYSQQLDSVAKATPFHTHMTAISATATLRKQTEEIVTGLSFMFLILSNLQWTLIALNTSDSWLAFYEILLLSVPNVALTLCGRLTSVTLLLSLQDGDTHDCVFLTDHLLAPRNGSHETAIDNADWMGYRWVSSEEEQGYCRAGCAKLPSGYNWRYLFTRIKFDQQAELLALTRAYQLIKDHIANIYIDSRYDFGVAHDFKTL